MTAVFVMGYVTLARLLEMIIARRNTGALMANGAREHAPEHYPAIIAFHVAWLAALWILAPGRALVPLWLIVFALLQPLRVWVMAALGARWTSRILIVPGETLVTDGPFRLLRHPNYAIVVAEVATLPLAFGLWTVALVGTLVNAVLLIIRIRAEDAALAPLRHPARR
ncbi:isoprenylcysteine carboxyl methyltransferase family protein [Novosphingobium sp.]|uniref:isoprenylcysteine carboxyl methyltransferase family protein n=1 Tax=Novosphingobium sp. TaxID=1874826 RepID=UPI003B52350C